MMTRGRKKRDELRAATTSPAIRLLIDELDQKDEEIEQLRETLGLIARNGEEWSRGWIVDRAKKALGEDVDDWYSRALSKLDTLNAEGVDNVSMDGAKEFLMELDRVRIKPDRIVRTAEATISMWFKFEHTKFRIGACEDGGFVLSAKRKKQTTHAEFYSALGVTRGLIDEMRYEMKK